MNTSPEMAGAVWLLMIVGIGVVLWRLRTRRRHIGSAGVGTVYDMLNEEKRNAIEIVVEDRASERDFEHADDVPPEPRRQDAAGRST